MLGWLVSEIPYQYTLAHLLYVGLITRKNFWRISIESSDFVNSYQRSVRVYCTYSYPHPGSASLPHLPILLLHHTLKLFHCILFTLWIQDRRLNTNLNVIKADEFKFLCFSYGDSLWTYGYVWLTSSLQNYNFFESLEWISDIHPPSSTDLPNVYNVLQNVSYRVSIIDTFFVMVLFYLRLQASIMVNTGWEMSEV